MNNTHKASQFLLFTLVFFLLGSSAHGNEKIYTDFGEYRVMHSVFNSSFIKPDIASAYNLTRGKDHALVNVAVIKNPKDGASNGMAAIVSGGYANLMQQGKDLKFVEIREQNAVYYLADMRFQNEEVLHFTINVSVDGKTFPVKFSKKLYVD